VAAEYNPMDAVRALRPGTSAETSALVVMSVLVGAGCLLIAMSPPAPDAPRGLGLVLGLAALAQAAALGGAGPRVRTLHLHVATLLLTGVVAVAVAAAATERGLMLSAMGLMWIAVYAAYFFEPRVAHRYAALLVAVLGLSMLAASAPAGAPVWIVLSAMTWAAVTMLSRLNERLRAAARTDSLTGVLNRGGFADASVRLRAAAERRGEPVALVTIDLDEFKAINDRQGHAAGDRLLVGLARAWAGVLRPSDLIGRYGGDEFVLLLPDALPADLATLLDRLARAHPAAWTGGTAMCSPGEPLDEAVGRADGALYAAKQRRRVIGEDRPRPVAPAVLAVTSG
jgi:diguanylate cyclase (GGDEF)-like protein